MKSFQQLIHFIRVLKLAQKISLCRKQHLIKSKIWTNSMNLFWGTFTPYQGFKISTKNFIM